MKKALLFTIMLACILFSYAQNTANLVIFTPQGERFQLVINGLLQNETPKTNVKVEGINALNVVAKVLFEDATIPPLDIPAIYLTFGTEATYEVRKNTKGTKYVLRPVSSVPIPAGGSAVVVNPNPSPAPQTNPKPTPNTNPSGVSINVNLGGNTAGISITDNGMGGTTTNNGGANGSPNHNPDWNNNQVTTTTMGCNGAMPNAQFSGIKAAVEKQTFKDQKMTLLKQGVEANGCISAAQAKEFIKLFSFESDKVEVAKYCYSKCFDYNNYYQVNDAFGFSSSVDELNTYIASQPKPQWQAAQNYPANFNNGNINENVNQNPRPAPRPMPKPNPNPKPTPNGCFAMNEGDFQSALASIKKQSFNDSKMQVAKQITSSNCLTCSQIKEVMKVFSFESTKLEYAKYAYDFAYDKGNYYQINDAFSFSSSVDELSKYIAGRK